MKMFYKKERSSIVIMLVLTMLLQIVGPMVGDFVYAVGIEEGFNFQVTQQADGSGRFEWRYNPNKANGQKEFEIDLKLKLRDDFEGVLKDNETGNVIGGFIISKDGILTATIFEKEKVEELEEDVLISDILVKLDGNDEITISAKITGASEDEKAKVEILNEEQELVDIKENIEIKDETLEVEFESLELGKYYAKITIGEAEELIEFVVEEVEDEGFEEEPKAGEVETEDNADVEDDKVDVDESIPSEEGEPETQGEVEETSFFGKTIATLAMARDSLGDLFLAQGDAGEVEEPSSGGGFLPGILFGNMELSDGTGDVNLTEVELLFNGKTIEEWGSNPIPPDATVDMKIVFAVTDEVKLDLTQTYRMQLPSEIKMLKNWDLDLKIGNTVVAKAEITEAGVITITFKEEINDFEENREVWVQANGQLDIDKVGSGGSKEIQFEFNGVTETITIKVKPFVLEEKVALAKLGTYNSDNTVTWTVTVTPTTNAPDGKIQNVKIVDILPTGQTYVSSKIGSVNATPTIVGQDLTFDLGEMEHNKPVAITIITKTDVTDFMTKAEGTTISYENKVNGTYGESGTSMDEDTETVSTTVNLIEKKGVFEKGSTRDEDKIKWTITLNSNNLTLPSNLTLEDTFDPTKLGLVGDITISPAVGSLSSANAFPINFTEAITKKTTITYYTKIIDSDILNPNNPQSYNNTATLKGAGQDRPSTKGVEVGNTTISKSGNGYDNSKHHVKWEIVVNETRKDVENPVVTDTLDSRLEFVSYRINSDSKEYTAIDQHSNWEYEAVEGTDGFKFTYNNTETDNKITDKHTIHVTTKIKEDHNYTVGSTAHNTKELYGAGGDNVKITNFTNSATISGNNITGTPGTGNKTQEYRSQVIKKDNTGYDYTTRKASWQIIVNQNKMQIDSAIVTDTIGEHHEFVENSLKLGNTPITKDGSSTPYYTVNGQEIVIHLGDISDPQTITFETYAPDTDVMNQENKITLSNTAKITGDQIKSNGETSTATKIIDNAVVGKKAIYNSGNDFIEWEVVINSNLVPLGNITLVDELNNRLELDQVSVKLYNITMNPNGTYIVGTEAQIKPKYTPEDKNKVEFTIDDVTTAYLLKFTTDITGDTGNGTISNSINLKGGNKSYNSNNATVSISFNNASGGASGSKTRGSITIIKRNDNGELLEGVEFELLDDKKNSLSPVVRGETDSDGTVFFDDLKMGTYYVREVKPFNDEYILSDDTEILLEKGLYTKHKEETIINKKKTYAIGDYVWIDDNKNGIQDLEELSLEGVRVELYNDKNGSYISSTTTNAQGLYLFDNLEAGEYYVKFILTSEQAEIYEFTKYQKGSDTTKDSNADLVTGWTEKIELNSSRTDLVADSNYSPKVKPVQATEGIDPTWDAGVIVRERISIQGEKIWKDKDDVEGYRPNEITINLQKKVGGEWATVKTITVKADNNWKWKFDNLYKTESGSTEEIEYRIEEAPVMHYERSYPVGTNNVTNTFNPNKREIDVTKVWEDFSNRSGERPNSIVVKLFADGVEKGTRTLKADEGWKGIFAGLNIYQKDGATEIIYTVEEISTSDGYLDPKITGDIDKGFIITNTRKTYAIGDYVWIDSNKDGIQNENEKPLEGVKVELFDKDKKPVKDSEGKPLVVYTDSKGKYIFDELEAGEYFVKFTLTQSQANRYTFTKQDIGDDDKDSDANPTTGWTEKIVLNDDNEYLTRDYADQEFKATEGIDPTWDAGVVLIPSDPYYPPTGGGGGGPTRPTDPTNPPTDPKPPVNPPTDPNPPVDPPVDIQEVPKKPGDPENPIKEETPKDTPKEGEIEVPEGSTPKVNNPPANGTVTINPNGKWTYTPNPGFVGKDSFTIIITHPDGTEEEIFVEIDVDEPPLGNIEAGGSTPEEPVKTLPKTGSIGRLGFYISGLLFIILGIFIVRRKTE